MAWFQDLFAKAGILCKSTIVCGITQGFLGSVEIPRGLFGFPMPILLAVLVVFFAGAQVFGLC